MDLMLCTVDKIIRFKEYRDKLKEEFISKLEKLIANPENFKEEFEKFIEEWQAQSDVISLYDKLLSQRRYIFIIFLLGALMYFNRLLGINSCDILSTLKV